MRGIDELLKEANKEIKHNSLYGNEFNNEKINNLCEAITQRQNFEQFFMEKLEKLKEEMLITKERFEKLEEIKLDKSEKFYENLWRILL